MRYEAYYIIRPKSLLLNLLNSVELKALLGEPQLWTHKQGGRVAKIKYDEIAEAIKGLYIISVKSLLPQSYIEIVFGSLDNSTEAFDKWWELELFDGFDENVEDVVRDLNSEGWSSDLKGLNNGLVDFLLKGCKGESHP